MVNLLKKRVLFISFLAILFFSCSNNIKAQNLKDSSLGFSMLGFQYSFDFPAADLYKTFGVNSTAGASYWYKTPKNWLFGFEYNYVFGDIVKVNPLDSVVSSNGYLINNQGQFQDLNVSEVGHYVMFKAGKIFRGSGPNPNSGLFVKGGAGFWLHLISYYTNGEVPPQISGNYLKGYDHMSYGPSLSESFGYLHLSDNHRINFSAELEIAEGFTKNQRAYNYDIRQKDNTNYFDMSIGIKLAWYFPLYGKASVKDKYFH